MLAVVVMILLAVSVAGAATYLGMEMFASARGVNLNQLNQANLDSIQAQLIASMRFQANGSAMVPMASNPAGIGYSVLPSTIFPNAKTPWGAYYHYCPLGLGATGGAGSVAMPGGTTYTTQIINAASTNANDYVASSNFARGSIPADVLALVVSPGLNAIQPPRCNQVAYDTLTGGFSVPGGSVMALRGNNLTPHNQDIAAAPQEVVLYVGNAASGDASGRDASNVMTFNAAMDLWGTKRPRVARMIFMSDVEGDKPRLNMNHASYPTTYPTRDDHRDMTLIFQGDGVPIRRRINNTGGSVGDSIRLPAKIIFQEMGTNGFRLIIPAGREVEIAPRLDTLSNSSMWMLETLVAGNGNIINEGGVLRVTGSLQVDQTANPALTQFAGETIISAGGRFEPSANLLSDIQGGRFEVNGGTIQAFTPSTALLRVRAGAKAEFHNGATITYTLPINQTIQIDAGGELVMANSTVNISGSGPYTTANIIVAGNARIQNTNFITNAVGELFQLQSGGELTLQDSVIGSSSNRPVTAVNAQSGGFQISGSNSTIHASTACWTPPANLPINLFSASQAHGVSASSAPQAIDPDYAAIAVYNRSSWTCNPP